MLHQSRASHFSLLAGSSKYFIEFASVDTALLAKPLLLESVQSLPTRLRSNAYGVAPTPCGVPNSNVVHP